MRLELRLRTQPRCSNTRLRCGGPVRTARDTHTLPLQPRRRGGVRVRQARRPPSRPHRPRVRSIVGSPRCGFVLGSASTGGWFDGFPPVGHDAVADKGDRPASPSSPAAGRTASLIAPGQGSPSPPDPLLVRGFPDPPQYCSKSHRTGPLTGTRCHHPTRSLGGEVPSKE